MILVGTTGSGLRTPALRLGMGLGGGRRFADAFFFVFFHNVPAESSSLQAKGWQRRLVLCTELSRSHNGAQRRLKKSPAITALAVSRYAPPVR